MAYPHPSAANSHIQPPDSGYTRWPSNRWTQKIRVSPPRWALPHWRAPPVAWWAPPPTWSTCACKTTLNWRPANAESAWWRCVNLCDFNVWVSVTSTRLMDCGGCTRRRGCGDCFLVHRRLPAERCLWPLGNCRFTIKWRSCCCRRVFLKIIWLHISFLVLLL